MHIVPRCPSKSIYRFNEFVCQDAGRKQAGYNLFITLPLGCNGKGIRP
jgi:hypothetical protein